MRSNDQLAATTGSDGTEPSGSTTTIDPAMAIDAYVDSSGGGGEPAGFPVGLAIGFLVVATIVCVALIVLRRRMGLRPS